MSATDGQLGHGVPSGVLPMSMYCHPSLVVPRHFRSSVSRGRLRCPTVRQDPGSASRARALMLPKPPGRRGWGHSAGTCSQGEDSLFCGPIPGRQAGEMAFEQGGWGWGVLSKSFQEDFVKICSLTAQKLWVGAEVGERGGSRPPRSPISQPRCCPAVALEAAPFWREGLDLGSARGGTDFSWLRAGSRHRLDQASKQCFDKQIW